MSSSPVGNSGSFRDPLSRVVHEDGRILRTFSPMGEQDRIASWDFIETQVQLGTVIGSSLVDDVAIAGAESVVEHPLLSFISYPFEWSFSMLQDAAILQLELVRDAALAGVGVKDASAYNVQFEGSKPIFIDIGSFQKRLESDPWFGYQQFCELFLYPLMLQAYAKVPFQPILRGSIDGIAVEHAAGLLGPVRTRWQKGRFTHVILHALAQRKLADADAGVAADVAESGMNTDLLLSTVAKLIGLVRGLDHGSDDSTWSSYSERLHYERAGLEQKRAFVEQSLAQIDELDHCWDVGCNDGLYSRVAAKHARQVLAMDADELSVDRLYRKLRIDPSEEASRITPLVVDLSTAGGGAGWRGRERPGLFDRSSPGAVIYLAVIHHLAITSNIPIEEQLLMLAACTPNLVIEFPSEHDPMVQRLLRNKRAGIHDSYNKEHFEDVLGRLFVIDQAEVLRGGSRSIYFARRRSGPTS